MPLLSSHSFILYPDCTLPSRPIFFPFHSSPRLFSTLLFSPAYPSFLLPSLTSSYHFPRFFPFQLLSSRTSPFLSSRFTVPLFSSPRISFLSSYSLSHDTRDRNWSREFLSTTRHMQDTAERGRARRGSQAGSSLSWPCLTCVRVIVMGRRTRQGYSNGFKGGCTLRTVEL